MYILEIILGTFGTNEILIIIVLALLLFGGKKIPELMRGLGTGVKEFRKATQQHEDDEDENKKKENNNLKKS